MIAVTIRTAVVSVCALAVCACPVGAQDAGAVITSEVTDSNTYTPVEESRTELESGIILIRENPEIEGLRDQIVERESRILDTEREINSINLQLEEIYSEKESLQGEMNSLNLTNRRNEAQIRVTEDGIQRGKLNLRALDNSIDDNAKNLETLHTVLVKNYQEANEFELRGSRLVFFFHESLFNLLEHAEESGRYAKELHRRLGMLENETRELRENKEGVIAERSYLEEKQKELEDRRKIYQFSIAKKESLIAKTKNDEAIFQTLLERKQEERFGLLREIQEYESRIEYLRDPASVPKPGKKVLLPPVERPFVVTQEFGETAFARANARQYGGPFHAGIDFGIPTGTRLLSSADGVIVGTGNTDIVSSCQSWGKWVLIEHPFGLTTLYAHLSLIKVRLGQRVRAGDIIGYSGNTGFSTGPHLHFGVYDSNGIQVVPYERISGGSRCRGLLVPVSAKDAKLNPRNYLSL